MSRSIYGSVCSIEGCDKPHFSRSWCKAHHARWRRNGDPLGGRASNLRGQSPADRFIARRTIDENGCWVISGASSPDDYPRIMVDGRQVEAHRWSYEHHVGPIPEGLVIDHLCRNPSCSNPDHLEPVTQTENVLRGIGLTAVNARATTCLRGHSLADAYVVPSTGSRQCRECHPTLRKTAR